MSIANHYGIKSLLACIIIIAVAKFLNDYRLIDAKDETDRSEYILIRDAHEVLKKCKKVGKTHRREYGNDVFLEGAEKETFGVREMAEYRPPTSQISKKCIATLLEYPSKLINTSICQHRFVWITGLHYSGTSLLNYIVQSHPRASGHLGVTTNMDEGQWLQAEYPPATKFGGTCRFMFRQKSFMDENHELATNTTRACLYADWARYWDLRRPVLIEKSPPSILQLRFRERLFPDVAASVVVVRHPLYACVAKRKKGGALFHPSAVQHALDGWLAAHDYLRESLPHLARYAVLQFEDFFQRRRGPGVGAGEPVLSGSGGGREAPAGVSRGQDVPPAKSEGGPKPAVCVGRGLGGGEEGISDPLQDNPSDATAVRREGER
eukprot:CAMPEP_0113302880 /NCGR_PEP_ID=MMETSP0010_2-20120614/3525_1 /TAXON_ID=216773 ORGANISM="Corethron hystrix, Strain 308" /NCGR_SAMPLE_ID=MMETSP0010_2 /ASSEMBLY_ACC=CAM_ASM_000155 /LENGTH=378 /DNA_ID=CAMNT_0000156777 /DNA_START=187 /DNA_END=1320 /DNA_ORIENTATION=+ /assembly_acc=CAM_ASM_000155